MSGITKRAWSWITRTFGAWGHFRAVPVMSRITKRAASWLASTGQRQARSMLWKAWRIGSGWHHRPRHRCCHLSTSATSTSSVGRPFTRQHLTASPTNPQRLSEADPEDWSCDSTVKASPLQRLLGGGRCLRHL